MFKTLKNNIKTAVKFGVKIVKPLKNFKKLVTIIIVATVISGLLATYSAKIMSDFVGAIEITDIVAATFAFQLYGGFIIMTYIVDYVSKIAAGYFDSSISTYMDSEYMKKFLLLDNNLVEKIGT